mmetsp:Transcript_4571/g.10853  ORF Transcript_4571/g.10853 Transcript_4571/m.10853 type:complete len:216 (+) Transcript_4571:465-1112(+)
MGLPRIFRPAWTSSRSKWPELSSSNSAKRNRKSRTCGGVNPKFIPKSSSSSNLNRFNFSSILWQSVSNSSNKMLPELSSSANMMSSANSSCSALVCGATPKCERSAEISAMDKAPLWSLSYKLNNVWHSGCRNSCKTLRTSVMRSRNSKKVKGQSSISDIFFSSLKRAQVSFSKDSTNLLSMRSFEKNPKSFSINVTSTFVGVVVVSPPSPISCS